MTGSSRPFVLEACVETIQQGLLAEKNHADRIEFCHRLDLGGVTPDYDLIRTAVHTIKIPVKIMIRPRGGDFIYSDSEYVKFPPRGLIIIFTGIFIVLTTVLIESWSGVTPPRSNL